MECEILRIMYLSILDFLTEQPIDRVLLPDTLGILSPCETFYFISEITNRYPKTHFDFHAHNDYDLSVSNVIESFKSWMSWSTPYCKWNG